MKKKSTFLGVGVWAQSAAFSRFGNHHLAILTFLCICLPSVSDGAQFQRLLDFSSTTNSGITDRDFFPFLSGSPALQISQSGGKLQLSKGIGDGGQIAVYPKFKLVGGFQIFVDVDWMAGDGDTGCGIAVEAGGQGINNYFIDQTMVSPGRSNDGKTLLVDRQTGQGRITVYRRISGSWDPLRSIDSTEPVFFYVFLKSPNFNTASRATVDNLSILADGLLMDSPGAVSIAQGVQLSFPTLLGRYHSLEWSPSLETNGNWTPLGPMILGNGNTNSIFDPFGGSNLRVYRVRVNEF